MANSNAYTRTELQVTANSGMMNEEGRERGEIEPFEDAKGNVMQDMAEGPVDALERNRWPEVHSRGPGIVGRL